MIPDRSPVPDDGLDHPENSTGGVPDRSSGATEGDAGGASGEGARGLLEWLLRPSLRDTDSVARAERIRAFSWGAYPGLFIGAIVMGRTGLLTGILTMILITLLVGSGALLFAGTVGAAVRGVTDPRNARARPAHSRADALLVRGEHRAALDLLEAALLESPDDAEAMLRIARTHRDATGEFGEALRWFRRSRSSGHLTTPQMRITIREILELARKMEDPAAAAPDLARHRDHFAGSDEGEWAAGELAEVKRTIGP